MTVAAALAGKHLVVTGFTGFLAKVYVAMLLERVEGIGRISLIARPRGRMQPAKVRVERAIDTSPVFRALRARHGADLPDWLGARLNPVDGDVEKPGCALTAEALEALADADVVVHCAGLTDFEPDPVAAVSANVAGALHAAELAERLRVPLVHVSTCYVAGSIGQAVVEERLTPGIAPNGAAFDVGAELRALSLACRSVSTPTDRIAIGLARAKALGWPNIYTYTKGLAEHALAKRNVALTIVRPSIVECARAYPFVGWNEGLNTAGPLAWLISTAFRRLPTVPGHRFDVVPVDDVAKGLAAITAAAIQGRSRGVYQLASGDHNPLTFERAVELTGLAMRRWTRKGHGNTLDRGVFRWLDPVPVPAGKEGPFAFSRLRSALTTLQDVVRDLPIVPADARKALDDKATAARDVMSRIDKMLALYRPFIHDNDWEFRTDRARALTRDDPDFRFDLHDIDWCHYWVDVEYPGLRTWCIPLIDGEKVAADAPGLPRFQFPERPNRVQVASK